MTISDGKTIGEIVAFDYRTAAVFKSFDIDFCCKGNRTITEVCESNNLSEEALIKELDKAVQLQYSESPGFIHWPLDLLIDYIEKKHHRYVREKIPELSAYLEKICKVHGTSHPELFEIKELFLASANELIAHMQKEEKVLFPVVRKMVENQIVDNEKLNRPPFGTVKMPIDKMMNEHDTEGNRFRKISELSKNYTPPLDACNTYQVTFALLKAFEEDLHLHIHLENNVLFPRAIELEKELFHA